MCGVILCSRTFTALPVALVSFRSARSRRQTWPEDLGLDRLPSQHHNQHSPLQTRLSTMLEAEQEM